MGGSHTPSKKGYAYLIALVLFAAPVLGEQAPDGVKVEPEIAKRCGVKGDVTMFTYANRDKYTLQEMLEVFEKTWEESWKGTGRATYVDSQRIIRDAYRKDSHNKYIRECCTDAAVAHQTYRETEKCVFELQF